MKKTAFILFFLFLSSVLYGCGSGNTIATNTSKQPTEKEKNNQTESNVEESNNKEEENLSLKITKLEKERKMFLQANELGQKFYWGMVNRDTELLDSLVDGNLQMSEDEFEAFAHLQPDAYVNYSGVSNFFLTDDESLIIIYTIPGQGDEAQRYLQVSFIENEYGSVDIQSFGIDA